MAFTPAAIPKSVLGYHRVLSPTAGVRVSPLCLGAMNFGDAWYAIFESILILFANKYPIGNNTWEVISPLLI